MRDEAKNAPFTLHPSVFILTIEVFAMCKRLIVLVAIIALLTACAPNDPPVTVGSAETVTMTPSIPTLRPATPTKNVTLPPTIEPTKIVVTALPTDEPVTTVPVAQPTNQATPILTQTPTAYPTALPTWTATPEPLNTPRPIPTETAREPEMGKLQCVIGVAPHDLLNIRAEAGADSEIIGTIPAAGQQIELLGETQLVGNSKWLKVNYYGREGWVNGTFLARQEGAVDGVVADAALQVLNALRDGDMVRLAQWVHPEKGVAFVPATFISELNPVFSAEETAKLWENENNYLWGIESGSGEEIQMDFRSFYEQYLFPVDFLFADAVGYDTNIMTGGAIDNSRDVFPDSKFVEYHFDGFDPDFGGLDFRTLRIVLEPIGDRYYVVAIVNNEWSP